MQKRITESAPLLGKDGAVTAGYSTTSLLRYDRRAIRAAPWRLKEWDFYQVSDHEKCAQFTIGHASYAGSVSAMLFAFDEKKRIEHTKMLVLPFGSLGMPSDAEKDGVLRYSGGGIELRFETAGDRRSIRCAAKDFEAEFTLTRKNPDSTVIAIPFPGDRHAFYYNQKINCMTAEGSVRAEGKEYVFKDDSTFGLLDWGRGVWPFSHEWYWSNGTGRVDGEIFGFNVGCGFGDTSAATENMIFYRGKAHKLANVRFELGADYMQSWRLRDDEGRFDLTLTPRYDRITQTKMLFIDNVCHQVFGVFQGKATLDDGTTHEIKDLTAFAEHAVNHW